MPTRILEVLKKYNATISVAAGQTVTLVENITVGFGRIFGYVKVDSVNPGPFGNILVEQGLDLATITDVVSTIALPTTTAVPFSRKVRGCAMRVRVQNTSGNAITIRANVSLGIYPEAETP
jgi:hypothetical protein